MRSKAIIPLIVGLGMGLLAIKVGFNMIRRAQASPVEMVSVVVAAKPIDAAMRIEPDMLRLAEIPKTLLPPGMMQKVELAAGRVAAMPIATGLPVTREMLAPEGSEPGLPSQIPKGHRAVSVVVDEATAVGGFVMPGHRVDVYASDTTPLRTSQGGPRVSSRLLLEDIQVGAVGQSTKMVEPDGKTTKLTRSVTLYVRPEDVPRLDAAARGRIRLVLRGVHDKGKGSEARLADAGKQLAGLFAMLSSKGADNDGGDSGKSHVTAPPAVAVKPSGPSPHVVEVYRGKNVERVVFRSAHSMERISTTPADAAPGTPPTTQ